MAARAVSGWMVGARVGAVAEKDPSLPWSEAEIKERVWALEGRSARDRWAFGLLGAAVLVAGSLAALSLALQVGRRG